MTAATGSWIGQELAAGRYVVTGRLGEGGMGFVYKAHDRNLDTDVVIKVPRPTMLEDAQFSERFNREIRSLVRLAHPHIVRITDVGTHDAVPYAVMQYLPGGSLKDRQPRDAEGKPLPARTEEVLDWLPGLAQALDFIHGQGYIHRDIKPANVLFDEHGHVYLSDFGVVKALMATTQGAPTGQLTVTGVIVGTPEYMAPELLLGQPFDGRADLYALATTVYELLGGRRPFEGTTPAAIVMQQVTATPPPLLDLNPDLPPGVYQAVLRAMSKEPAQRFPSCVAFAAAVTEAARSGTMAAPAPGVAARLACPACGRSLALGERTRGRRIRCPSCQAVWRVADDLKQLSAVPPPAAGDEPKQGLHPTLPTGAQPTARAKVPAGNGAPARARRKPKAWLVVGGGVLLATVTALGMGLAVVAAMFWWPKQGVPPGTGSEKEPPGVVVSPVAGQGRYQTIGDALRDVAPGTRIKVKPGIYNEMLEITRKVEIVGDGPVDQVVLQSSTSNCVSMKTGSALIRGLTILGRAGTEGKNLYAVNLAEGELVLEDCDISSDSLACVAIHAAARPVLRRCKVHDGKAGGIFLYDGGRATLEDCEVYANDLPGIEIDEGADPMILRCRVYKGKQSGVFVHGGGRGTLEECDIFENRSAGVVVRERGDLTLRRCRVQRNRDQGITINSNGSATVEDCDLTGNEKGSWWIGADCQVRRSSNKEDAEK